MIKVQVLGSGCPKCAQTAENGRAAARALGIDIDLIKVDGIADVARFGVMYTPALAVDGKVRVSGRVPTPDEIKDWLQTD